MKSAMETAKTLYLEAVPPEVHGKGSVPKKDKDRGKIRLPKTVDVADRKKGGFLAQMHNYVSWKGVHHLKSGSEGRLLKQEPVRRYKGKENVTRGVYTVPGTSYRAVVYFDRTGRRIG